MAALSLDLPIFRFGRTRAAVRSAQAQWEAAQRREESLWSRIRLEVESALLKIEADLVRAETTAKAVAQAQEALRIEEEKYALGKGTLTDLLDAQAALLEAQTQDHETWVAGNIAVAELHLAMGDQL